MRKSKRAWLPITLLLCVFFGFNLSYAQTTKIIQGVVSDESGETLPGASVTLKGTKNAVLTDVNGKYKITVPNNAEALEFRFVGTDLLEVKIGNRTTINVTMKTKTTTLSDVVVVGYGVQKKSDLTGAVQRVTQEDLNKEAPTNVLQALQGKVAGVEVTQSEGAPGASVNIKIRGAGSFYGSSEPLYVIDGIPFNSSSSESPASIGSEERASVNAMDFINPSDIESIDILKDASATAIYGSRGANGVVLITTRQGKAGKDKIELNFVTGISSVTKTIGVLNQAEFAAYQNLARENSNIYTGTNFAPLFPGAMVGTVYVKGPADFEGSKFNWQDQIFRTGGYQNYTVNVSGGSDAGTHSLSFNYLQQKGTVISSDYQKFGTNINLNRNVGKFIKIGTSTSISRSTNNGVKTNVQRTDNADAGVIRSALTFPPTRELAETFEETRTGDASFITNPVIYAEDITNTTKILNIFSSNFLEVKISKDLKFRQNVGLNLSQTERDQFYPRTVYEGYSRGAAGLKGISGFNSAALESILTYTKKIKKHNITGTLVGTYETTNSRYRTHQASNFPIELLGNENLALAQNQALPNMGGSKFQLQSFLGRVNYTYADRYLITASLRRDGSSKFYPNNPYAYFPSAAFAWRVINEKFLKNKISYLSDLKLRLSYGQTGNQGISAYSTYDKLVSLPYILGGSQVVGIGPDYFSGPGNPDLKWETTESVNLGLDLGLFSNRWTLTVDAYNKNTKDLLQSVTVAPSTGFPTQLVNAGNVRNRGLEITLAGTPVKTAKFDWNFNFNIAFNRNKIMSLGTGAEQNFAPNIATRDAPFIQKPGHPIGALFGYVEDGYYDNEAEVRTNPVYANLSDAEAKRLVGEIKYVDLDGNPLALTDRDRTFIGDVNPDYTLGLRNNFRYKNFDLSMLITAVVGNDIINMNTRFIGLPGSSKNITQDMYYGAWREGADNSNATNPKIIRDFGRQTDLFSRRFIEDGSFVRLKNVSLGYTLKTKVAGLQGLKFAVMANNLFTLTKYSGYDPEVSGYGNNAARAGVDLGGYPNLRSFNLSVRANF